MRFARITVGMFAVAFLSCANYGDDPSLLGLLLFSSSGGSTSSTTTTTGSSPVESVQSGLQSMAASPATPAMTLVDRSRSVVFCSMQTDNSSGDYSYTCRLDGTGQLEIASGTTDAALQVQWYVVQFTSGATVEHGSTTMATGSGPAVVAINTIDTSKAFPIVTALTSSTNSTSLDYEKHMNATLTSSTLTLTRSADTTMALTVQYQIVQLDGASVQTGTAQIAAASTTGTGSVSGLNSSTSFLMYYLQPSAATVGEEANYYVRDTITDASTLTFTRAGTTGQVDINFYAITMGDGTSVQHGQVDTTSDATPADDTDTQLDGALTTVDTTRSVPLCRATVTGGAASDQDSGSWTPTFQSGGAILRVDRASNQDRVSTVSYSAIQFAQ